MKSTYSKLSSIKYSACSVFTVYVISITSLSWGQTTTTPIHITQNYINDYSDVISNLTLQDNSIQNITEDSSLAFTSPESEPVLVFLNTIDEWVQHIQDDTIITLDEDTNIGFDMGSDMDHTLTDPASSPLITGSFSGNTNQITFHFLSRTTWQDAYNVEWGSLWDDGFLLRGLPGGPGIPEPITAILSLVGLPAFLMRRRKASIFRNINSESTRPPAPSSLIIQMTSSSMK